MTSELVILGFPSKNGAKEFLADLLPLQEQHLVCVEDAALAMKDERGRVFGSAKADLAAHGLLSGSLWGTLTGALFFEPFFGLLLGGTLGLLTGSVISESERGISTKLVKSTAEKVLEPASSALFLLISKATPDKLLQKMCRHEATLISTSLSLEKERKLRKAWNEVKSSGPLSLHRSESESDELRRARHSKHEAFQRRPHETRPLGAHSG